MMNETKVDENSLTGSLEPSTVDARYLFELINQKRVVAPVGTRTFALFMVSDEGKVEAAGVIAPEHIDELAYWLMTQKRAPKMHE